MSSVGEPLADVPESEPRGWTPGHSEASRPTAARPSARDMPDRVTVLEPTWTAWRLGTRPEGGRTPALAR